MGRFNLMNGLSNPRQNVENHADFKDFTPSRLFIYYNERHWVVGGRLLTARLVAGCLHEDSKTSKTVT